MEVQKSDRQARMLRFQLAIGVLATLLGALILSTGNDIARVLLGEFADYRSVVIAGLVLVGYGIAILMMLYLQVLLIHVICLQRSINF